jgi:hypothetical protein
MIHIVTINGNDISVNCKITTYADQRVTYSFGNGRGKYCLTASYDPKKSDEIYIDRVERTDCIRNQKGKNIQEGTTKLVRLAIYTLYQYKPDIQRITLKDDSYLYCYGNSGPKISIAYDYLLKYNQTWYQKKFGAVLPGFLKYDMDDLDKSKKIQMEIDGDQTVFHVIPGSPMDLYLSSISNLDQPCVTYEEIIEKFPEIKKHHQEYESSVSPRDFINQIRKKYEQTEFCKEGSSWFKRYLDLLKIKMFYDLWYIPVYAISIPTNYEVIEASDKNKNNIMKGGKLNRTRKVKKGGVMKLDEDEGLGLSWSDVE